MIHQFFTGNAILDKEEFFLIVRKVLEYLLHLFPAFWNFVLFNVDKSSITAGKLVIGLSFLVTGYVSIRLLVSYFERRVLSRLDIEVPKKYTIKILLFYFLISLLFLFTLYLINIPLTVFTVVGGAIALGIGFGAKNIMSNLISGIVIVLEHPIRIGDLIEIDTLRGIVDNVGFRATTIKTLDNTHIIVPNSFLLEQKVLNWTLSDKVIRSQIRIGVAYGSPVKKVEELLLKVAENQERVLTYNKNQKPMVFFSDFGDNSLVFQLNYWVAVENIFDIKQVASMIRFEIYKIFGENNITIAFPQRDLHIKNPIKVDLNSPPS